MQSRTGLSSQEVLAKKKENLVNVTEKTYTRSYLRIFTDNIFSYFNIIMTSFFVLLLITGNYKNIMFMGVVVSNLFMSIVQEIKMKHEVDRLSVIKESRVLALRDGNWGEISDAEIVVGDVLKIKTGDSLSVDAVLLETDGIELDESTISGESEPVLKQNGNEVFSGSCVLSGTAIIEVLRVGSMSLGGKIAKQAKEHRRVYSPLTRAIEKIIKIMSFVIMPLTALLFCSQYFVQKNGFDQSVVSTAGAVIGMIPSGLVLLTTVTMALGVLRSAYHGAFISQQKAVETLARIDTLCIDKTGTITGGNLQLTKIVSVSGDEKKAEKLLYSIICSFEEKNATATAAEKYFKNMNFNETPFNAVEKIAFSSGRKYSAVKFENEGFFAFGAPEFLVKPDKTFESVSKEGGRILAIVKYENGVIDKETGTAVAYVKFEDDIREGAAEILKSFRENGVDIKIISGDSITSITDIASRVGFSKTAKAVDMSLLKDKSDDEVEKVIEGAEIFGRCDPQQKRQLVRIFQENGRIVAMTGDGVNDVPAMRKAHCAVAMSTGADAAKGVADVVLKESFDPMTQVIMEGRRVINNMSRVSALYLVKTMFSLLLSLYFLAVGAEYPLLPIHLTLIGGIFTGMPSFFMAMEKNLSKIKKDFALSVIMGAVPGAVGISCSLAIMHILQTKGIVSAADFSALCVWITGAVSGMVLFGLAYPFNAYRGTLISIMTVLFILAMLILSPFMEIAYLSQQGIFILLAVAVINAGFVFSATKVKNYLVKRQSCKK